jgi:hypothetical protein
MAIGMMGFGLAFPIFDRYLWPLVPPIATLLLLPVGDSSAARSSTSRAWERLGIAALLSLLAFAVVLTMNSHAWDAARWRAGEALVRAGLRPEQIDAGYEWMGYHAAAPARPARQPGRTWYASWWPDAVICGVATSGGFRLPDSVYIGRVRYRLLLIAGPTHDIQLYRIQTRGCD